MPANQAVPNDATDKPDEKQNNFFVSFVNAYQIKDSSYSGWSSWSSQTQLLNKLNNRTILILSSVELSFQ